MTFHPEPGRPNQPVPPFLKPRGTGLQIAFPRYPLALAPLLRSSLWATCPWDAAQLLGQAHRHSPWSDLFRPLLLFPPLRPDAPLHASQTTAQAPSRLCSCHLSSCGQPCRPQEYPSSSPPAGWLQWLDLSWLFGHYHTTFTILSGLPKESKLLRRGTASDVSLSPLCAGLGPMGTVVVVYP